MNRETVHTSINAGRDWEVKQHALMVDGRLLNETFNLASMLQAVKAAAGIPVRLTMRQPTAVPVGMILPLAEHCMNKLGCQQ
jgi:hypothetical protein